MGLIEIRETDIRLNAKLEAADLAPMSDLVKDFSDGVKLIQVSDLTLWE